MDTRTAHPLLAEDGPPRAAAMIVTIYGDVVDPRGGSLWMGDLIDLCAKLGLSETLVRTAVSRLVTAGQLEGTRLGRRSYYALTADARVEYRVAAEQIYGPPNNTKGWSWLISPDEPDEAATEGFAHLGGGLWLAPGQRTKGNAGGSVMHATTLGDATALAKLALRHWELDRHSSAYSRFLARFAPLEQDAPSTLEPDLALIMRLSLVHAYRHAVLRDPHLPVEALPPDWPAAKARALFSKLYSALTPAAERAIVASLSARNGPLESATDLSRARLEQLQA